MSRAVRGHTTRAGGPSYASPRSSGCHGGTIVVDCVCAPRLVVVPALFVADVSAARCWWLSVCYAGVVGNPRVPVARPWCALLVLPAGVLSGLDGGPQGDGGAHGTVREG